MTLEVRGQTALTQLESSLMPPLDQPAEFAEFFERMKRLVLDLAGQNFQLELAKIASESRMAANREMGGTRLKVLEGRVTEIQGSVTRLETCRADESKKAEKDLAVILASQKTARETIQLTSAAKVKAAEDLLKTTHRIGLPKRIADAQEQAKRDTLKSCREKSAVKVKGLLSQHNEAERQLMLAVRNRLERVQLRFGNILIPKVEAWKNYYPTVNNKFANAVADGAWRGARSHRGNFFPGHFHPVGLDDREPRAREEHVSREAMRLLE